MLFKNKKEKHKSYDASEVRPVLQCSICTGETVAGFKNMKTGVFEEIMLIRDERDLLDFKNMYQIAPEQNIEKVY